MLDKNLSYIYGLLITDGYLNKKNNKIVGIGLEVNIKDLDIVEKLHNVIPFSSIYYRSRKTNFSDNYDSCIFQYNRKDLPNKLIEYGFPVDNKTFLARAPLIEYDKVAFWRGAIDGDGSLGLRKNGNAFLSFTTQSEDLKKDFCLFLQSITGRQYNPNRNKRDNIYNIGCNGHSAEKVIKILYENIDKDDLFLNRKYNKMKDILKIE